MRVIAQSPDPLARIHTMTEKKGKSGTIDEPGGICISRVVRDQVRDKLDFALLSPRVGNVKRTTIRA
jgi:hypothetical protein